MSHIRAIGPIGQVALSNELLQPPQDPPNPPRIRFADRLLPQIPAADVGRETLAALHATTSNGLFRLIALEPIIKRGFA